MHLRRGRHAAVTTAALSAVLLAGAPAAARMTINPPRPSPAASFAMSGVLAGVAATSATNAWAVGYTDTDTTLIVHWNGKVWKRQPSPPAGAYHLQAVA